MGRSNISSITKYRWEITKQQENYTQDEDQYMHTHIRPWSRYGRASVRVTIDALAVRVNVKTGDGGAQLIHGGGGGHLKGSGRSPWGEETKAAIRIVM